MNPFVPTDSINLVAIAADLYCVYLAIALTFSLRTHNNFLKYPLRSHYGPVKKVINQIRLPEITDIQTLVTQCGLIMLLLAAIISSGMLNRFCLAFAIVAYFFTFANVAALETNRRKTFLIPLFLGIFAVSPGVSNEWQSDGVYWPIWALKLALCQIYVGGAITKLRTSGLKWADGKSLQRYLLWLDLFDDNNRARTVAGNPGLCKLIAASVLAVQMTFWIILISPSASLIYLVLGIAFHISTAIVMRIYYLKYIIGAYLVLLIDGLFWLNPEFLRGLIT